MTATHLPIFLPCLIRRTIINVKATHGRRQGPSQRKTGQSKGCERLSALCLFLFVLPISLFPVSFSVFLSLSSSFCFCFCFYFFLFFSHFLFISRYLLFSLHPCLFVSLSRIASFYSRGPIIFFLSFSLYISLTCFLSFFLLFSLLSIIIFFSLPPILSFFSHFALYRSIHIHVSLFRASRL